MELIVKNPRKEIRGTLNNYGKGRVDHLRSEVLPFGLGLLAVGRGCCKVGLPATLGAPPAWSPVLVVLSAGLVQFYFREMCLGLKRKITLKIS